MTAVRTYVLTYLRYYVCSTLDGGNQSNRLDKYLAAAVTGATGSDKSKISRISPLTLCFKTRITEYQVIARLVYSARNSRRIDC